MFGKNQNKPISTFRVTRVLQKLDSTIGQQNTCDKNGRHLSLFWDWLKQLSQKLWRETQTRQINVC